MRILISNPDTIGDLVLRQPLFAALRDAGHELMLIVRPGLETLVARVAPEARVASLPYEAYSDDVANHWPMFDPLLEEARSWSPEALVVAPYRWTQFDEHLAESLPGVPRFGMSGHLYAGNPHAGAAPQSRLRFDVAAAVEESQPEVSKNAALASAILGRPVPAADPRVTPDADAIERADAVLRRFGLEAGGFWIAATAGTVNVPLKVWRPGGWGEVLSHWAETHGRRFLFIGQPQEVPLLNEVRDAMGPKAGSAEVWSGDGDLGTLVALIGRAGGYAGHDSGPMHLAAAAGKPVLAVFGGGTWPRFVPAVSPSCAITVGVPCAGCNWFCTFSRPHCIRQVPVSAVKQAADDLEAGRITDRELRVIPPDASLHGQMLRESAEMVRVQIRRTAELSLRLDAVEAQHSARVAELSRDAAEFSAAAERKLNAKAEQIDRLNEQIVQLQHRVHALEPKPSAPREPLKVRVGKAIAGKPTYPLPRPGASPSLSLVFVVRNAAGWIREAIDSAARETTPAAELIVVDTGSTDGSLDILREDERVSKLIERPAGTTADALADGLEAATGEVLGFVTRPAQFEPAALRRVAEFFRDHPRTMAAYAQDNVETGGWRRPAVGKDRVDVFTLLDDPSVVPAGVFFRKSAYGLVGRVARDFNAGAEYDLALRLARMFGLHPIGSQVRTFLGEPPAAEAPAEIRQRFLARFGWPGRARCRVLHGVYRMLDRAKAARGADPLWFAPSPAPPTQIDADSPPPRDVAAGDRLLFSFVAEGWVRRVDLDQSAGLARIHPPIDVDCSIGSVDAIRAPELVEATARWLEHDASVRFLQIGARGSRLLDDLRVVSKWVLSSTPAVEDAPLIVPEAESFDVIFADSALARSHSPDRILSRLRLLLSPAGAMVLLLPNLGSTRLLEAAADWAFWKTPGQRWVVGTAGLRRAARLAGLKVVRLQPYGVEHASRGLGRRAVRTDQFIAVLRHA